MNEEITEQKHVTFDQALSMIDSGEINDCLTAHAVQLVARRFSF